MTVFGVSLSGRPMWVAAVVAGVAALTAGAVFVGVGTSESQAAASAGLECDATQAAFGDPVTCTVSTKDGGIVLRWGDGQTTEGWGAHTHAPAAIGPTTITVTHGETVLARHTVEIVPDVAIDCDYGLPHNVYELTDGPSATGEPYDYVYLADDGTKIFPGDAAYPVGLREILALERSVVEEAPIVGLCRSESAAVDALGGTVTWTVESPWYDDYVTHSRKITPGTPAHWEGVQPIDVTLTVDVDGYEASERIGVYFGGCG